ncbi:hypothetical protein [Kitasatospora sp. LaBMicrA B282]|uniref:hypothetical protein n=1 Tax=Kitasatospora sp. LaBMicrA B282 TaxID=3420949 RepID=UPI003D115C5B
MAEQLQKLDGLKKSFTHFDDMSTLLDRINTRVQDINERNKQAAGNDDTGKQYHAQIDKPTKDLTQLIGDLRDKMTAVGYHGQGTADLFDSADQDASDAAGSM